MANGYLHHQGTKFYPAPYFPIGSVYLSVVDINPSTYFGGTWVKMSGGYLYGVQEGATNSSYTGTGTQTKAAVTSGSTAITIDQLPVISGDAGCNIVGHQAYDCSSGCMTWRYGGRSGSLGGGDYTPYGHVQINLGKGQGHTHSIPAHSHTVAYIGVWVWKRTA